MALAGCAGTTTRTTPGSQLVNHAPPPESAAPYWWRQADDPILARLIDSGLEHDQDLDCAALALDKAQGRMRSREHRIDTRLKGLFDTRESDAEQAGLSARAYRYAAAHADLATRIALAYIEVRALQETLVVRSDALDAYADNSEIAAFREEAGLVPGVDTGLADTALTVNEDGVETAHTAYASKRDALARLAGITPQALQDLLGEDGRIPELAREPVASVTSRKELDHRADLLALERGLIAHLIESKVSQAELDAALAAPANTDAEAPSGPAQSAIQTWRKARQEAQDELADLRDAQALATSRQVRLDEASGKADETRKAARLAYRNGMGDFATLYVAEKAALSLTESRIAARAALASAAVRIRAAQGLGWSTADLDPPAPPADGPEVLVCE